MPFKSKDNSKDAWSLTSDLKYKKNGQIKNHTLSAVVRQLSQ